MPLSAALATRHLSTELSNMQAVHANCTTVHVSSEITLADWGLGNGTGIKNPLCSDYFYRDTHLNELVK